MFGQEKDLDGVSDIDGVPDPLGLTVWASIEKLGSGNFVYESPCPNSTMRVTPYERSRQMGDGVS